MTAVENRSSEQAGFGTTQAGMRAPVLFVCLLFLLCVNTAGAQTNAIDEARQLFLHGSNQRAAQVLESEIKSHPEESEAHLLLGQIYALEDRRGESLHELSRAVELQPDSAPSYNMLGTALSRFAEFDTARKAYEQAVALDPNMVDARINLAMALAQANDRKGAVEQLTKAIELRSGGPGAARAHYLLAKIYENDDAPKAIHELEAASRIDPRDQQTWLHIGILKDESGDQGGALTALQRAVACDPRDAESQYELGSEYLIEGDGRQATIHLQIARKLMPKPTMALLYKLDRALRKTGDTRGAEQIRAQAQELITRDDDANQQFRDAEETEHSAIELERHGDLAHAVEKYRAALEINPRQDRYRYNYGLALCRLDRFREGIAELHEVLENDPGNIDARRALFIAEDKERQAARIPGPSKP